MQPIQMQLSPNLKTFPDFFFCISGIYIKFETFWKKRWALEVICFWNYTLQKAGLLKCLKRSVSEHLWTVNMLKGPKHCLNLHGRIFSHIFWSYRRKISSKNYVLVVSKILRLFVNIWHSMTGILSQ